MLSIPLTDEADLRTLDVWHADEFAAHMERARDHIRPWVGPSFVTESAAGALATLRVYAERAAGDGGRLFGIWSGGVLVGGVMFVSFSPAIGSCELGCWLEPEAEGHGLVTRAIRVLIDWAFGVRGLHRAEWRCRADNARSSAVAGRLGMSLEGVLRESWPIDGAYVDTQVWSVLAQEWTRTGGSPAPDGRDSR